MELNGYLGWCGVKEREEGLLVLPQQGEWVKQNIVANSAELRTWKDSSAFTQTHTVVSSNTDLQKSSETSMLLSKKNAGAVLKNCASQMNVLCTSYSLVNSL